MTLLASLPEGCPVGVDTAPFIYFVEGHDTYGPLIRPFFAQRVQPGFNQVITSVVTLSEMLVQPLRDERTDAIERYRRLLTQGRNVKLVAIDPSVAEKASSLRATHGIRLPDAFQIAAALQHGARHFLTNDTRLKKVREIEVLVLDDYVPRT